MTKSEITTAVNSLFEIENGMRKGDLQKIEKELQKEGIMNLDGSFKSHAPKFVWDIINAWM